MKQKFQDIPKFDQSCEMVVQLEPEIQDDCIYFPVQVVKIPAEQLDQEYNDIGEIIIGEKPVATIILPVSKDGLCTRDDLLNAGFVLRDGDKIITK